MRHSYIKGLLGGPTPAEYEALKQEKDDLKQQLGTVKQQLEDLQAKVHHPINVAHILLILASVSGAGDGACPLGMTCLS